VANVNAPLLDAAGNTTKDVALEEAIFGAEVKKHLVHEAVRAEANAQRAGTFATKSRGLVSGGRAKPWRQKGTGRARAGTIRAPQFTTGGHAFAKVPRSFEVKVNRKAKRAAFRSALSAHVDEGTLGILDVAKFGDPSTKAAAALLAQWGKRTPLVVVVADEEEAVAKSFRNLERVVVVHPSELEIAAVVWARSLLVTEKALELVQGRAS
jgi:large subunit ribosomal protein L4